VSTDRHCGSWCDTAAFQKR